MAGNPPLQAIAPRLRQGQPVPPFGSLVGDPDEHPYFYWRRWTGPPDRINNTLWPASIASVTEFSTA